jgi:hypothetical protein
MLSAYEAALHCPLLSFAIAFCFLFLFRIAAMLFTTSLFTRVPHYCCIHSAGDAGKHSTVYDVCSARSVVVCVVLCSLAVVMHCLSFYELAAQARRSDSLRSSRGRDFRFAFPPNFHEPPSNDRRFINDSLYVFITSDKPASGMITYRERTGRLVSIPYSITDPEQFYTLSLLFRDVEIEGFNASQQANPNSQNERISNQSFHITATEDVTVYALNQARYTSDAMLVLPVTALGKEYRIMSYNSDARGLLTNLTMPGGSTPSQFCIVAAEDNTDVTITPSAPTPSNPMRTPRTITLNEGEVYLVQADPRVQDGLADLTGSYVVATKPVAVFGSHQRTTIPIRLRDQINSRDHLLEQLPGVETWGKEAFITPYTSPRAEILIGSDLYRVLAAYDSTRVFVNGQQVALLSAGQHYEASITNPAWITASDQILVAQYKKTSNLATNQSVSQIGDPFMMIIPTAEQYDNSYRFINVQVPDPSLRTGQVFDDHFATLVVPTRFAGTVRVDGTPVPLAAFRPIVNSGYSFANVQLAPGVHTARADTAFGLYVYGYGLANSYGYIGGGRLRVIAPDRTPPLIASTVRCFEVQGMVYDTVETDSRIASVEFLPTTLANVSVQIERFTPFADSVGFRAQLQNIYRDGSFTIRARDSIGFITQRTIPLYGFTVGLEGQSISLQAPVRTFTINTGRSRIFPLTIINYGSTTQTITTLSFTRQTAGYFLQEQLPITLAPSSRATINVRFVATQDGLFTDTLVIGSSCTARAVAAITIQSDSDREPPTASRAVDECARTVTFQFRDDVAFSSGIASLQVLEQINCNVRFDSIVNSQLVRGVLTIQNPRLDAIYSLRVTDSSGNILSIRDTVSGLTLRLVPQRAAGIGAAPGVDTSGVFGAQGITNLVCRSIFYQNVGVRPFTISLLAPRGNRYFSLPVRQFPLVFQPGETRAVQVCFSPLEARTYRDTLLVEFFCTADTLILTGSGIPLVALEATRCSVEVRLTTSSAPQEYFVQQNFPNPSSGLTTIALGISAESLTSVKLYNTLGGYVATLAEGIFPSGTAELTVDVSRLEAGMYFYEVMHKPLVGGHAYRTTKSLLVVH